MRATYVIRSRLHAPKDEVWAHVSSMAGVNAELAPWLKMTVPSAYADESIASAPTGQMLFPSWILLFGVLPYDRHALRFDRIDLGTGFAERSTSFTQREWRHTRTLHAIDDHTTELTDHLDFTPRLALATPLVTALVRRVFRHRHAKLRARFGGDLVDEPRG